MEEGVTFPGVLQEALLQFLVTGRKFSYRNKGTLFLRRDMPFLGKVGQHKVSHPAARAEAHTDFSQFVCMGFPSQFGITPMKGP